ncbi:MAG: protein kinase [Polyangiaceae bacterium]|nr:protein kinase [Polyangiaceae bacterium]
MDNISSDSAPANTQDSEAVARRAAHADLQNESRSGGQISEGVAESSERRPSHPPRKEGESPSAHDRTPRALGEFEVVRRLGIGGMAEVFLAKKRGAEGIFKLLVLKRILPEYVSNRKFQSMFTEEAQLATRLNHPNIVQVYDFQDYGDEGQLLSMEYVDGPDLRQLLRAARKKEERISPELSAFLIAEVAKGLHYAHERKDESGAPLDIVHRDVSPQNILLSYDGAVKVADFGIASANLFRDDSGVIKGKTGYMSPEQASAKALDRRTDIYSLGIVLHEMLSGRKAHGSLEGDDLAAAVRKGRVEPPSNYVLKIPKELDAIVMKALAIDPDERYQNARDFSVALLKFLLERGEVVDGHSLETILVSLVGEPHLFSEDGRQSERPDGIEVAEDGTPVQPLLAVRESGSEVRHVAVVAVELVGGKDLVDRVGLEVGCEALERLVTTLDAVAFKREMRLEWQRDSRGVPVRAHGVAGLLANATGAAADAVWFAVDLHDGVLAARNDLDSELRARVGIVRSLATGRRDASGHLVEHQLSEHAQFLADTLCQRAELGSSLVAGGLYRLVRRDFLWGDAPNLELNDSQDSELPARLRVYELIRGLTREEKRKELSFDHNELIGRDAELADLHATYYRVVGTGPGQGQAAARLVGGELGIGKTALIDAFVAELPPDARVLRTECAQARQDVPFAVLGDWLRDLTGVELGQEMNEARRLVAGALDWEGEVGSAEVSQRIAELCTGRLGLAFDEADAALQRAQILAGTRRFLGRAAQQSPLVVILDAMQWCDQISLELISQLLNLEEELPILALLVTRPDRRIAPATQGILRLDLGGLDVESQARLLQVRLGVRPGVEQVCADIFPRAAGNPFFLLEMVDALLERGVLEIREDATGGNTLERVELAGSVMALPTTLEQLLADRLTELGEQELSLLYWVAVAGGPADMADIRQLFDEHADEVAARLDDRGLTETKAGQIDVKHPLTRDVTYRSMNREERRARHRGLGELLAATGQYRGMRASIVARHLAKGGMADQAAELYLEAAGVARSSYQIELATRSYEKVAKILPNGDYRLLEAYEALEAIARNDGRWRQRKEYLDQLRNLAAQSGKGYWVATCLLRSARYEQDAGHLARAAELAHLCEEAALEAESQVAALQARGILAEVLRDLGDMQGALAAADRALAAAEHPEITDRLRAEILRAKGTLLRRVGRVEEALGAYAESIAVFQRVGARRMEARGRNSLAFALYMLGRYEDGVALARQAMQIESSIGGRFQIARTLANIGLCYAGVGDSVTGLSFLRQAREAHERYGERDARADTLLATAEVLLEVGEVDEANLLVGDASALIQITESRYDAIHERLLRSLLARAHGDSREAVRRAFEARQAAEAQAYSSFHFYAMAIEAICRVEIGENHTGILLATTALGAASALQGSEYALQIRALCTEALFQAGSPHAETFFLQAAAFTQVYADRIRNPELWKLFMKRAPVQVLLRDVLSPSLQSNEEVLP